MKRNNALFAWIVDVSYFIRNSFNKRARGRNNKVLHTSAKYMKCRCEEVG